MIPANELLAMQQEAQNSLDLTADIQRSTKAPDGYGQMTETWASILPGGTPIPAALATPSGSFMQAYAGELGNQAAWIVSLPYPLPGNISLQPRDRILINGLTLTVENPLTPRSYPILTQVMASELR